MVEQPLTILLDCTFEVLWLGKPQGEWGRDELPREVKGLVREKVFFLVLHKDLQRISRSLVVADFRDPWRRQIMPPQIPQMVSEGLVRK